MKHLTTYKLFESTINNMNEYYFDMIYLLQDVFDDFDVTAKTDEIVGEYGTPEHKFWSIRLVEASSVDGWASDISNISEVGGRPIKYIVVFNITTPEKESFKKRVNEVGDRFISQTGMRFKLKEEAIDGFLFDYVIEINNPIPKVNESEFYRRLSSKELLTITEEVIDKDDFPVPTTISNVVRNGDFQVPYSIHSSESDRGVWIRFNDLGNRSSDYITMDQYKEIYPIIESKLKYLLDSNHIQSVRSVYVPHGMSGHNRYVSARNILTPDEVLKEMGKIIPTVHLFDPRKYGIPAEKIVYDRTGFDYIDVIIKS
jgi:hypothetical protein